MLEGQESEKCTKRAPLLIFRLRDGSVIGDLALFQEQDSLL